MVQELEDKGSVEDEEDFKKLKISDIEQFQFPPVHRIILLQLRGTLMVRAPR